MALQRAETGFEPSYPRLSRSGELDRRAEALAEMYRRCTLCPRACGVDRVSGREGECASGDQPSVASFTEHFGEEPPISAQRGSGTIFFANCNLQCVYCQNWQISHMGAETRHHAITVDQLADIMLRLQKTGVHNINFVSPSHFTPSIVAAVAIAARRGLRIPLVYNSNGYDSLDALKLLEGVIDIYMPDLKYADAKAGERLSGAPGYPEAARAALREMFRQVGELQLDETGAARRGLLIRHLVLPEDLSGSIDSLRWILENLSPRVALSVMAQYYPAHDAAENPPLHRRVRFEEYQRVVAALDELGMDNGWVQDHFEAPFYYRPDFTRDRPFES